MNKTISIIRIAILLVISTFAFIFLFGEEQGDDASALLRILVDKALAFAAFWYVGKLYKRWSKVDPWLMAYDKMCDEVLDKPNPMRIED